MTRRWLISQLEWWREKLSDNDKARNRKPALVVLKENVLPMQTSMTPAAPKPPGEALKEQAVQEATASPETKAAYVANHGPDAILYAGRTQMRKYGEAYMEGMRKACSDRGVDYAVLVKHAVSMADLLGFLPGGSLLEGAVKPAPGASRAETMALGGGGGLLGTLAGGGLGAALTAHKEGPADDMQTVFSIPATLGGMLGGGYLGNIAGRWLAERKPSDEQLSLDDIKEILEKTKGDGDRSSITINMSEAEKRPGEPAKGKAVELEAGRPGKDNKKEKSNG